jgi:hypothetical protein
VACAGPVAARGVAAAAGRASVRRSQPGTAPGRARRTGPEFTLRWPLSLCYGGALLKACRPRARRPPPRVAPPTVTGRARASGRRGDTGRTDREPSQWNRHKESCQAQPMQAQEPPFHCESFRIHTRLHTHVSTHAFTHVCTRTSSHTSSHKSPHTRLHTRLHTRFRTPPDGRPRARDQDAARPPSAARPDHDRAWPDPGRPAGIRSGRGPWERI